MRYSIIFIALLIHNIPSFSQENSLLWEVTGNGIKQPSYIYGTMHVRDARVFDYGDSVIAKFNKTNVYAGEIIIDKATSLNIGDRTNIPGDSNLQMLIGKKNYRLVKSVARERLGVNVNILNVLKPYYTSFLLNDISRANDHHENLDQYFQNLATTKKKKLIGIETFDEQMAAIDRIPMEEQINILLQDLRELDHMTDLHERMITMYMNQQLDSIDAFVHDTQNLIEEHKTTLVLERNHIMADRIATFVLNEPTFVGINVIHLPGSEGVIELLRKKGYKVRPVINPFKFTY